MAIKGRSLIGMEKIMIFKIKLVLISIDLNLFLI